MPDPTSVLDHVLHLATLVQADLTRFEKEAGLSTPRVHLLWVLGEAGPTTQQALSQALGVTPRNVTGLVDGLVASGHVTREPHPADRRATLVTPTPLGTTVIRDLVTDHRDLAGQLFGDVDADRLAVFDEVLRATTDRFAALLDAATGADGGSRTDAQAEGAR